MSAPCWWTVVDLGESHPREERFFAPTADAAASSWAALQSAARGPFLIEVHRQGYATPPRRFTVTPHTAWTAEEAPCKP